MKKILLSTLSVAVVAAGISTAAYALTLAEKKKLQDWEVALADSHYMKEFEETCGYALPVTLNENLVTPFMEDNTSAYAYCEEVVSTMVGLCGDDLGKEAVSAKIKALSCEYATEEEAGFSIAEDTGTLTFKSLPGYGNIAVKAKEYLEENL